MSQVRKRLVALMVVTVILLLPVQALAHSSNGAGARNCVASPEFREAVAGIVERFQARMQELRGRIAALQGDSIIVRPHRKKLHVDTRLPPW